MNNSALIIKEQTSFHVYMPPAYSDPNILVDASQGNVCIVHVVFGAYTVNNPTNPKDGQLLTFEFMQEEASGSTVTFGNLYSFSPMITNFQLSDDGGYMTYDFISFVYNGVTGLWHVQEVWRNFKGGIIP